MTDYEGLYVADLAVVTYHAWWPSSTDPFYQYDIPENTARINYYGADYTPHFRMDGVADGAASPGLWTALMNTRLATDAPLTIVPSVTYDAGTRSGVFSATVTNVSGASQSGQFRLALTESGISWLAPNGLPEHDFVMRDMVPDPTGTTLSLGPGGSTVVTQPYVIRTDSIAPLPPVNPANCQLICWVQNDATREILQGARVMFPVDRPCLAVGGSVETADPGGDHDAYVDAGESGALVVTLANLNQGTASSVSATLSSSDPYFTVTQGSASFGDIPAFGRSTNSASPYHFTAAAGTPSGYRGHLDLTVTYGSLATTTSLTVNVAVGSPTDPSGPAGVDYAYENADAQFTKAPAYDWVEIDPNLGGSGTMILNGDEFSFWYKLPFTFRYYGANYDTVTTSSNGWTAVGKQLTAGADPNPAHIPDSDGPYGIIAGMWCDLNPAAVGSGKIYRWSDTAHHRYIFEWSGVEHADSHDAGLAETFEIIFLDPNYYPTSTGDGQILVEYKDVNDPGACVAGIESPSETTGIEYSYFGTPNPAAVGIVDGRAVLYTTDAPEVRSSVPGGFAGTGRTLALAASPNPFHGATEISFALAAPQPVSLRVYGVDGRLVSTLFAGPAAAGVTRVAWRADGAAPGLYLARLTTPGGAETTKIMRLR